MIEELIYRQYKAQKKRKKIKKETKPYLFMLKLNEEVEEALNEFQKYLKGEENNLWQELFDVISVCFNFMIFSMINIKKEWKKNVEHQETRKK